MTTDKEKHELKGPVESVFAETVRTEEQNGQIAEQPLFSYVYTFNREGQLIEQTIRNPDGSEWRTVNDYSDSGNLLVSRSFDAAGVLHDELRYIYDANDRLTLEQHVSREGKVTTPTTYVYDNAGRRVKIQELDSYGEASMMIGVEGGRTYISASDARRVESRYDEQGDVFEVKVFNAAGALVSRMEITRDARGNPLEETQHIGDDFPLSLCASDSCSTEDMSALSEEQKAEFVAEAARLFSPGTVLSRHTHRYDTEGRLIESTLTMMGMEVSRQTFAYDEFGNKSEEVTYNENGMFGTKAIFTREYDNHGNWTREVVSNSSIRDAEIGLFTPTQVTRRVITYR